jgi:serine/threonine-protein kinase
VSSAADRIERASDDIPSQDQLGRYVLNKTLGVGAHAAVYLADDRHLCRRVAVKIPFPELVSDDQARDRFRGEAIRAASLEHPHIVPLYDFGETVDGRLFAVSKYIDGSTLGECIRNQRAAIGDVLPWIMAVADAADFAHKHGIIHRDIKPSNILIDRLGKAWLSDFGLSIAASDGPSTGAGTPAYMCPEHLTGQAIAGDTGGDTWALGVVLYEALTGVRPFSGPSLPDLIHAVANDALVPPSQINPQVSCTLDSIVCQCLNKNVGDRIGSAGEFALRLHAVCTVSDGCNP